LLFVETNHDVKGCVCVLCCGGQAQKIDRGAKERETLKRPLNKSRLIFSQGGC